jgi:hypothetical protein
VSALEEAPVRHRIAAEGSDVWDKPLDRHRDTETQSLFFGPAPDASIASVVPPKKTLCFCVSLANRRNVVTTAT